MSDVSRIFLVEGEEGLNRSMVNSLRKDGYFVQGVASGADAMRALWAEEYNVVICDLRTPGVDGLEMLQWLRVFHPHTRIIIIGEPGSEATRMQMLESGASSYLEKPLDFRMLKEELRRLLQQPGFSASLDSFDLLDVIQIITMGRNNIALLVSTGLEEQGMLRFQNGELVWAEYGTLRGEEAFFALAAHKNGTVVHQPWHGSTGKNVTQPLSRLILQALQYRTKANMEQQSGEQQSAPTASLFDMEESDENPFAMFAEPTSQPADSIEAFSQPMPVISDQGASVPSEPVKEWWEKTGTLPAIGKSEGNTSSANTNPFAAFSFDIGSLTQNIQGAENASANLPVSPAEQQLDLPSWLTDQPTSSSLPSVSPSGLTSSAHIPAAPPAQAAPEWQLPPRSFQEAEAMRPGPNVGQQMPLSTDTSMRRVVGPGRQASEPLNWPNSTGSSPAVRPGRQISEPLTSLSHGQEYSPSLSDATATNLPRMPKTSYNYSALVSALQTLGYSITGFIAAAVVNLEGQPVAQVAVDDMDISGMCLQFSAILKNISALGQGKYEDTVITMAQRRIFMRLIDNGSQAFQVLITTREANTAESLEVMANVEGALSAALR
ncbi:response regulator [Ktedonosporobacter rubrisoli]|uniref:Response regulator n=1 Tax=Ktedonosporobacter rubrisoli TaxID=2509675 RepID=A0A4P6K2X3_KTERU|nr:response regulator [Ktedonosporobacter rubrisoli]QBD81836.1 response regulator [Ktedonosporobacter rubrisoli]